MVNNKHRILVVDDDQDLLTMMREILELEGYQVITAVSGKEAIDVFRDNGPSLVLLDLFLPDMDGLVVCQNIRRFSQTPIIMLTGRNGKDEIAAGLYAGADDYITKPFSHGEFFARVAAALRRASNNKERLDQSVFQYQDIKINYRWQIVTIKDKKIDLTETEYKILVCLAKHMDEIVDPRVLAMDIWNEDTSQTRNNVRVNIFRLRNKLDGHPGHEEYIKTIPGKGYSFR
jgi:two-component system, OmpR family, response regulator VicR